MASKPAKQQENIQEVETARTSETANVILNEAADTETPTDEPAEVVEAPVKESLVRVRGMKSHNCTIGHEHIVINAGKETKISNGAALILQQAGIIIKL